MDQTIVGSIPTGDRDSNRALVVIQLNPILDRALPEGSFAHQQPAPVILDRSGNDLGSRRGPWVDQHNQFNLGRPAPGLDFVHGLPAIAEAFD